jgi:hypothetical protein
MPEDLQSRCELGQRQLMEMKYLEAEATLAAAEEEAWAARDFDTLSRLYMPLQETRRQRRQRCGEGIVRLDLLAAGPDDPAVDAPRVIENFPHGQLLVAGWKTIEPALGVRRLQRERGLFVETFLAAVFPAGASRIVAIMPTKDVALPSDDAASIDELIRKLPPHSIVISDNELPKGARPGTPQTYGEVMSMWERLHSPFLAAAEMQVDAIQRIEGYRKTIRVDYACELAHQKLSQAAKKLLLAARA